MRVEKFNAEKEENISKLILDKFPFCSHGRIMKAIRNKDIKVDGKRIGTDEKASEGAEITLYLNEDDYAKVEIVFEDENIVVANKPRRLETISENSTATLFDELKKTRETLFAVHRLDMNTTGLVVFAKNNEAKKSLDDAFKNRTLEKFYVCLASGKMKKYQDELIAYLKKDEKKSLAIISSAPLSGYAKIQTNYKVLKEAEDVSVLEVELVTGKTHQIRAHLAHIMHPIVGDEKYGDREVNRKYKSRYQCLCAYKIVFHFKENDYLSYLNGKQISLDLEKIDFLKKM